ncbi:SidA/IucD/PvdA family monooxygenase [Amycolatopsis ultiminotia]|uniref:L-lysine N6-monooxygenase MbtG n=1 Tax=Amycolatopsis ultiminotia TaxID=543629 RepID=A0ABP6YQE9_9PSEU
MRSHLQREAGVPHYTVAGLGAGPANLSFAALAEDHFPGQIALFEARSGPAWHPGLLFPGTQLQTSWIKDLVSLADPRHRVSFLNYLVRTGRVYSFLNAQYTAIPRLEYARYLAWAAEELAVVHYGQDITEVGYTDDRFTLHTAERTIATADHLVLGMGTRAHVPECFGTSEPGSVVLAENLEAHLNTRDARPYEQVIVVGGGQTGAECALYLLGRGFRDIRWIGRRHWFAPLDDSPSANDFFRPSYLRFFQGLPGQTRQAHTSRQVLTSDGVSMETLQELYRRNYEALLSDGRTPVMMLPGRTVVDASQRHGTTTLWCERDGGGRERHTARLVVLATGRTPRELPVSGELAELMDTDGSGEPVVEPDYSLRWKHDPVNRIFVQNRARLSHGLADPNLSLLAVRSAVIVNSLLQRELYEIRDEHVSTIWG